MAKGPIRVLELLVTTSPGGGPQHVWDLARHLPKNEFELIIGAPRDGAFFDRFRELGLQIVELPLRRLGARHFALTRRAISRFGVDLVHTHGKGPGLYGRAMARWMRVPAIHTFHGLHYADYRPITRPLYLAMERRLSRWSRFIISVSRSADLVIGCVSRFDPVKRIELLVDALRRLKDQFPRLMLVLVGGGGELERIRRMVAESRLSDRVVFTGFVDNPVRVQA